MGMWFCYFCFFKQKTAYEMRISDWSSDVCSSDLDADRALLAARRLNAADRARAGNAVDAPAQAKPQPLRHVECVGRDTLDGIEDAPIGRASCRERVCQYV